MEGTKKSRANELTYPFTLLFIFSVGLQIDVGCNAIHGATDLRRIQRRHRDSCSSLVPSPGALALTQIPLACGPSPFDKGDFKLCLPC